MNNKTQTLQTYNNQAAAMAAKFGAIGVRSADIQKGFSYLHQENPFVLEIGCGSGRDATEILKHTNQYLGMDASVEMLKLAQEANPEAHFVLADIEAFEFPTSIDLIFAFASLLHSDREAVREIFGRAKAVLKPGGIYYISLKEASEYQEVQVEDQFGTRTFYYYTPTLIQELAGTGYQTVWEDHQKIGTQDWFTLVLKRNTLA